MEFVPDDEEGKKLPIATFGDGLTVMRILDAQKARCQTQEKENLACFHPCPQEFHKRGMLMNVGWNYTRLNSCYSQLFFSCEGHHKVEV
jgi:hypothetical protein